MHQKIAAVLSLCLAVYRGDIVTVNDAQPQAEVLAVKDGKILMVGSREQIEKELQGRNHDDDHLAGKTLTPSFIVGCTRRGDEVTQNPVQGTWLSKEPCAETFLVASANARSAVGQEVAAAEAVSS